MSIRLTLTDAQLPPSWEFLEFLDLWMDGARFDGSNWATYGQERVAMRSGSAEQHERHRRIGASEAGMRHLSRAYELFVALLIGDVATIDAFLARFRFVLVVGAPRSGGKYLTKALFRALGHVPEQVPAFLAHDGFPDAGPWRFDHSGNEWIASLQTMAEYLTMVELFFDGAARHGEQVVVPKKATKAAYAAGLYQSVLGCSGEGIITVRHPVPACISTYESAGGLPADGRHAQRGNIERFCARDLVSAGFTPREVAGMNYFDAYLRYWEDYHLRLAMSGANITRNYRVVAYGSERYMQEARRFAAQFGAPAPSVEVFHTQDRRSCHPDWMARAEPSLHRINEQWARVGLAFPLAEVGEAW